MPAIRNTSADGKTPSTFPEIVLPQPSTAWLQVLRNDSWDPASVRIIAVHDDGQGVRLDSPIPLPRGTRVMVNLTLSPQESVHVQGVVHATRKNGDGSIAVLRFEHQTEADVVRLVEFVKETQRPAEQPILGARPESRRYQRFVKSVPVQYQLLRADGEIQPGQGQMVTLNIGGGGMKIRVEQKLESGDLLYLHLPIDNVPFFSLGRVIWLEDSRVQSRFIAGLQFVDLCDAEQDRLTTLLTTS